MRILFWIGRIGEKLGSLERYNILLAEKCKQREHEIIIMHDIPNTIREYNARLEAANSRQLVIGHTYADPWRALLRAVTFVRGWRPDVVHTHFVNPIAMPLLKLLQVPLVYQTWHNSIDHTISLRTRLIRYVGTYSTSRMLVVSEQVRRDEIRAGVPKDHLKTLYIGLPVHDYMAAATQCSNPIPYGFDSPNKIIIITVARFFHQKGMQFVIDAAITVLRKHPNVIWWLVGDGPEKTFLEEKANRSNVRDRLLFLGVRNDIAALMRRSYVHVLGSLFEGLGMAALEAGLFGVPTVGTRIGGLDEAIIDGTTGLLVPVKSADALSAATARLIEDVDLRNRLGQGARRYILEHFDSERLADSLLDMYETDFEFLSNQKRCKQIQSHL